MSDSKIHDAYNPDGEYTTRPTHLRVWCNHGQWFVDGADDEGRYTETVNSYDEFPWVIADLKGFVRDCERDGLTFEWRGGRAS